MVASAAHKLKANKVRMVLTLAVTPVLLQLLPMVAGVLSRLALLKLPGKLTPPTMPTLLLLLPKEAGNCSCQVTNMLLACNNSRQHVGHV
jgi:hypothetical protein